MKQFFAGFACALALVAVPVAAAVKVKKSTPMTDWVVIAGQKVICKGIFISPENKQILCMRPVTN